MKVMQMSEVTALLQQQAFNVGHIKDQSMQHF
jgi:hypothetical protein